MSQPSSSAQLDSTWGKFSTQTAAQAAQSKLQEAGIAPEKITLETEDSSSQIKLEDTQAIADLKVGAIAGGVLGFLVGLSISLILTDFVGQGLAAFHNFQTIHYFAPIMGAIVGAVGIGLISGINGGNVPKSNFNSNNHPESKRYLVVVKGTAAETSLASRRKQQKVTDNNLIY
jgi:hypothetical protein